MNDKFYVPLIEEFHVGFEYEVLSLESDLEACVFIYDKEVVNKDINIEGLNQSISINKIKVKYLDKEDILECGWVIVVQSYKTMEEGEITYFRYKQYELIKETKDFNTYKEIKYQIKYVNSNTDYYNVYYGEVKNKSILKQLMNNLNIK